MGPFCARPKAPRETGYDDISGSKDSSVMAEKKGKKGGVNYCAAGGPNKTNCWNKTGSPGISMHYFPSNETVRQKWIRFVRIHRKDFIPKKSSTLCSAHFDDSCFEHKPVVIRTDDGKGEVIEFTKRLIKGSIPCRYTADLQTSPVTERKRQSVSSVCYPCMLSNRTWFIDAR